MEGDVSVGELRGRRSIHLSGRSGKGPLDWRARSGDDHRTVPGSIVTDRATPSSTFLSDEGTTDTQRHKLFIRQVEPLDVLPLDGRQAHVTLARGSSLLESMNATAPLKWWIGVGTALGYARERDFIPGDSDLDIRIALDFRDASAAMAVAEGVVERFHAEGFRIAREMYWDGRPMQTAFFDTQNEDVVFDIFYFYTSHAAGHYVNFNDLGSRTKPARFIENLERSSWPGHPDITVYLPSPIEEYNEWRWGPEWRIPKRNEDLDRDLDLRCITDLPTDFVVLTYGTFDLFHDGHVRLLERAAAHGDRLVVGVVSDEVLHQKGKRSSLTHEQRADIVASLACVDEVFVQEQLDQKEADIERFDVSTIVMGDDWADHPRFEQVRGYRGVDITYLPRTLGVSSSALRQRVADAVIDEAYESLESYRAALDPAALTVVEDAREPIDSTSIAEALAHPTADKVVLFRDRLSGRDRRMRFDLFCQDTIVIDLNRLEVHKKPGPFARHGTFEREAAWLKRFHGSSYVPELISAQDGVLVTRYVGEPVRRNNLPTDWRIQAEDILTHLERKGCQHNDIKCDNLTVFRGQLYLIDFGWATEVGEAIPGDWPVGIGRQHRLGVHRFDDRTAIFAALDSAERDQVDRSIRMYLGSDVTTPAEEISIALAARTA